MVFSWKKETLGEAKKARKKEKLKVSSWRSRAL